ncbi:hypothetical protein ACF1BQ_010325 [Bradyrhizobium sp. RDT10]
MSYENSRRKLQHGSVGRRHRGHLGDRRRREPGRADGKKTSYFEDRTITRGDKPPSSEKRIINIFDQPPVRVIGAPFVPNTNPRER